MRWYSRLRDEMQAAYPELKESAERVSKVVLAEEEQFARVLVQALALLDLEIEKLSPSIMEEAEQALGKSAVKGQARSSRLEYENRLVDILPNQGRSAGFVDSDKLLAMKDIVSSRETRHFVFTRHSVCRSTSWSMLHATPVSNLISRGLSARSWRSSRGRGRVGRVGHRRARRRCIASCRRLSLRDMERRDWMELACSRW